MKKEEPGTVRDARADGERDGEIGAFESLVLSGDEWCEAVAGKLFLRSRATGMSQVPWLVKERADIHLYSFIIVYEYCKALEMSQVCRGGPHLWEWK